MALRQPALQLAAAAYAPLPPPEVEAEMHLLARSSLLCVFFCLCPLGWTCQSTAVERSVVTSPPLGLSGLAGASCRLQFAVDQQVLVPLVRVVRTLHSTAGALRAKRDERVEQHT